MNRSSARTGAEPDLLGIDVGEGKAPDLLVEQLAAIWREVLEVPAIHPDDDFFESGGTSLHSAVIVGRIRRIFGCEIGINTFFTASTVEKQAALLRKDPKARVPKVIAWREGGSRPPLFCVPGGAGHILAVRDLLLQLPDEQPVYGLEGKTLAVHAQPAPGTSGDAPIEARIEDIATANLADVTKIQPTGPYYLAGLCFGGIVVFEMARQLIAKGEQVAFLALLDPPVPGLTYAKFSLSALGPAFGRWLKKDSADKLTVARRMSNAVWEMLVARWNRVALRILPAEKVGARMEGRALIHHAVAGYHPDPYGGQVTIFFPEEVSVLQNQHAEREWRKLSGSMIVQTVPGHHGNFFRAPQATLLAQKIVECFDQARTAQSGPAASK